MAHFTRRIVVIGANSAIAEHCMRQWVGMAAVDLILVSRNPEKAERVAADLQVRSPASNINCVTTDFLNPQAIQQCAETIALGGALDLVLIAHGALPDQVSCQQDLALCSKSLTVNGISPALFAEAFAGHMQKADTGILAVIGSVAGDRGRKSNYVYGSAKGMVCRYVQGLQHRLSNCGVRVVLIKPGPTDTPMTSHFRRQGARLAKVEHVAQCIVRGIESKKRVIYAPSKWWLIMLLIRHLPLFLFNRLDI
jgi:short-subunit dehydrogenase